ncbi:DNA polymerase I [Candidatus Planktophila versatilis]|uniref:DNA polymerase I n=1 Tax=Candidatus Planktophila versatilis TaxID=1884905 RepID=UPI000BACD65A|nr:DNA polymerase I [Candidatus Planktophila versatilis]
MTTKRLLLIDGHSMAYRAFFALPAENFTTAQGQHTNAIYGFATMLISLLKDEKPTHVAVAFDVSRKTFRTEIFPEYKANRAKTPDEFRSQMSYLNELVKGFGISQFSLEGFEADDLIATITKRAEKEGAEVLICTGDRDSFQLVTAQTTVLYPKRGVSEMARMTPQSVQEKYGMTPDQYPDFAALRGDPSDNLPSIPGVGEKTAAKWVVEYGSLTELLSKAATVGGKVGESLRANIDNVVRNRELTQLIHDAPITFEIDALAWKGVDDSNLTALFEQLEFRTLKERLKAISTTLATVKDTQKSKSADSAPSLFGAEVTSEILSAKEADAKIASHTGPIAIACDLVDDQLQRYAVALSKSSAFLVDSLEMGSWASDAKVEKIAHDGKAIARQGVLTGVVFDTSLAAYLVNPGVRAQDVSDLLERWGDGSQLDESSAEQLLLTTACALFGLRDSLTAELENRGLTKLYNKLELPIADLLAIMENRGIAVDKKELQTLAAFFDAEVARETKNAHEAAGHEFNVASPKQLQVVLFDELGLPKTKKIKTGFTTDADALSWLFEKTSHPVLAALLRIRETKKLATTIEGLVVEIKSDKRIHTHFAQTVAATGRLSSVAPNLQNIPVRTEEGRKIRNCFIAGSGYDALLTADYSQIEMRIMAHLSNDEHLLAAFESGEDLHATVAAEVFGVKASDVDPEMRRQIKAMSYGLAYGLSSYGLAVQLDLTPPAAQDLMDRYFERFGGIRDYLKTVVDDARKVGYTETVMGRRRYLPDLLHDNRQRREVAERMALNAPIQGSAADIIKQAMLNVQQALVAGGYKSRLLLQVHDELILEVVKSEVDKVSELVRMQMGSAFPLRAPLDVSVGIGASWNEAAH